MGRHAAVNRVKPISIEVITGFYLGQRTISCVINRFWLCSSIFCRSFFFGVENLVESLGWSGKDCHLVLSKNCHVRSVITLCGSGFLRTSTIVTVILAYLWIIIFKFESKNLLNEPLKRRDSPVIGQHLPTCHRLPFALMSLENLFAKGQWLAYLNYQSKWKWSC